MKEKHAGVKESVGLEAFAVGGVRHRVGCVMAAG